MKRMSVLVFSIFTLLAISAASYAADNSTSIEEAFVDAVGSCGGSSKVAAMLSQSKDPGLRRALRYAVIVEAADDAAAVPGSDATHSDCVAKALKARGLTSAQMEVLPDCVSQDWPDPLTSLGSCVVNRAKLGGSSSK